MQTNVKYDFEYFKDAINKYCSGEQVNDIKQVVNDIVEALDNGDLSVAENLNAKWVINTYIKQAIILYFKFNECEESTLGDCQWNDKVPLKKNDFKNHFYRILQGSVVREGAFIGKSCVIMPSFINIGARIGELTMIDSLTTIGTCAQIGKHCHISSNVCIGGVLEPVNANPVIIEDNCFIGANSSITEGVIIGANSVIASGVHITSSTKIIDTMNSYKIIKGYVPEGSVIISGNYKISETVSTYAAILLKKVDSSTRNKVSINDLLRDNC